MRSVLFPIFLLITGCGNTGNLNLQNSASAISVIAENTKKSALSKSFQVRKMSTYQLIVDGETQKFANTTVFNVEHLFVTDTGGNLKLTTSYRSIEISDDQNGAKERIVVEENSDADDSEMQIWSLFLKSKPFVVWNRKGEVLRIGGLEMLADSIFSIMNVDPSTKYSLQKKWKEAIADMQQSLSQNLLPGFIKDTILNKGSSWTVRLKDKAMEVPVDLETRFTLDSWNERFANILSSATMDIDNAVSSQVPGAKLQLKGKQTGSYKIDLSTGLVSTSIIKTNAKGALQLMGKTIPVNIENEVSVIEQ